MAVPRPTRQELLDAWGKPLPDLIAPGLKVLFCGINPGLYSGAVGHHFARPGNRFWKVLHAAGFTGRLLDPSEEQELLTLGLGITDIVGRATRGAHDLDPGELVEGGERLLGKVREYRPRILAFLGLGAYRVAFGRGAAMPGKQRGEMNGTAVWVLPSPSGRGAYYRFPELVRLFTELRQAADEAG